MAAKRKRTQDEQWKEFYSLLIDSIDVRSFLEQLGVNFTGACNDKGWAECHAVGRDDRTPSAAVNIATGYYKDLGPGPSVPFFQLLVHLGYAQSYRAAVETLATNLKLRSMMPKSRAGMSFWSRLKFTQRFNALSCRKACKELGIDVGVLEMVGAMTAITPHGETAICLPVYCPDGLFDVPQVGMVLRNAAGGMLFHDRGTGAPAEKLKNKSVGSGGILNRFAVERLDTAEVILKVEGISDMLCLQNLIPIDEREKYVVVTNSDGCDAVVTPRMFLNHAKRKKIVIIHDADEPGQFGDDRERRGGAVRWVELAVANGCKWVANVQLPFEISPKHGKDLRDWIGEGGTWSQLLDLIDKTEKLSPAPSGEIPEENIANLTLAQQVLRTLNLMVLGHRKSGGVEVFNAEVMRRFVIKDIDRFSYNQQLIHIGRRAVEKIHNPAAGECPPGKIPDTDVRNAISEEAHSQELSRSAVIGIGIWELSGRLVAVGAGEWLAVNGGVQVYTSPKAGDRIVDFGEREEAWYDREQLESDLTAAKSPSWRTEHFKDLTRILSLWGNHKHPEAEWLIASYMLCTWVQQVWPIRPWIALEGETNSAKTALMEFLTKYFGKLAEANVSRSEAGIRAAMRHSSKVLLMDEFEASPERTKILDLLMGSTRGGLVSGNLRSTAGQEAVRGGLQVIPWMAAIEMQMDRAAERNRYVLFSMNPRKGMDWFEIPSLEEIARLRQKSIAVSMSCWKRAVEICHLITSTFRGISRMSESYSIAVAMRSAVLGDTDEKAIASYQALSDLVTRTIEDSEISDQDEVLSAILGSSVILGGGVTKSVGQMVNSPAGFHEEDLNRMGIRVMIGSTDFESSDNPVPDETYLFVDGSKVGPVRRSLLAGTEYRAKNISAILERLEGSVRTRTRINGRRVRGVAIPIHLVRSALKTASGPEIALEISPRESDLI